MTELGVTITAATITILVLEYFRRRRFPFPFHGWMGIAFIETCVKSNAKHGAWTNLPKKI